LGALTSAAAIAQYHTVLRSLKPVEIPEGYRTNLGVFTNFVVAVLGVTLAIYLFVHGATL
jgi:putative membrane protein